MTSDEKSEAAHRAMLYGLWALATFAGPFAFGWWSATTPLKLAALGLLAIHVCAIPFWQGHIRRVLCSTEWAQARGFMPHQLRLFQFRPGRPTA